MGNHTFDITCIANGMTAEALTVDLNLTPAPIPEQIVTIYGPEKIGGEEGTIGSTNYSVISDIGINYTTTAE
jgi:hypothetical protein